ncbi:hypothetical protein I3843_09G160500 [Carya illinoinensis]|uniref:DRBM domain-containing protein n=1 Tax=Carya illinoinensis TaxID=32201 RepID=A0A922E4S2_CARIL|nr:hypothetical protein I3842_09G165400 [Carya illinoinensis]KAG6696765.1 hypothetical protein I3842_09G165400 [Carya illinoinensis]KAG6696766.1 hypothetical protein I3842_09G165400 [Carya illinoinensis]KAG7964246.1 hypothetical protein I3843_09G160500 [Carya illinoinensis]KAG7964247.1 hypothetical protein I3843_09G160500 [Carya illinoinensis]
MYKSRLQELCHKRSWSVPVYTTIKDGPDHNPRFKATVTVNGGSFHTQNPCRSSKEAQNDAASVAFHHLTNPNPPPPQASIVSSFGHFPQPSLPSEPDSLTESTDLDVVLTTEHTLQPKIEEICQTPQVNGTALQENDDNRSRDIQHLYKNQLQNYAQKRTLSLPVYSCECEGPPHVRRFKCKVTIDGQTYESPEFFSNIKDAEHAAAKLALTSLSPDGVRKDDSGLYKNLLQEFVQKEGLGLPVYDTIKSGEAHAPIFVSTVEIDGKVFKGQETRNKKQAEMSAAKVAYTTMKECKSGQSPMKFSPAQQEWKTLEFSSSSPQPNVTADLQHHVGPKAPENINLCTINLGQAKENRVSAEVNCYPSIVSSGPDTITTSDRASLSSDSLHGCAPDTSFSTPFMPKTGLPSHSSSSSNCSTDFDMESLVTPVGMRSSSCKIIYVLPRKPNMTTPKGCTVLPMSDDKWVAFSPQ